MSKYTKDLWNRDKDGNRKEQRSFLRYAIIATVVFLLFMAFRKSWVEKPLVRFLASLLMEK